MISIRFVCLLVALILFVLAAMNVPARGINLLAFGLALLALSMILTV